MSRVARRLRAQLDALAALLAATDRLVVQGMERAGAGMFRRNAKVRVVK